MRSSVFTFRKLITYGLLLISLSVLVGYAFWQARLLITGPIIVLNDTALPQTQRVITLSGRTENIVGITLNGRSIFTDKDGYFAEPLVLEDGYTLATLAATDRYGRVASIERSFVYTPK